MSSARAWRWTSGLTRLPPPRAAAGAGRQPGGRAGGRAGGVGGRWVCSWELGPVEQSGWKGAAKRGWAVWAAACRRGLGAPWPPRPAWPCQPADCHPPSTPLSHRLRLNLPPTTKPQTTPPKPWAGAGVGGSAGAAATLPAAHASPPAPWRALRTLPAPSSQVRSCIFPFLLPSSHQGKMPQPPCVPSYQPAVPPPGAPRAAAGFLANTRQPHVPTKPLFTAPARTP